MENIRQTIGDILLYLHRTFHRATCANECCSNRCECTNEGESSSEEVSSTSGHEQYSK